MWQLLEYDHLSAVLICARACGKFWTRVLRLAVRDRSKWCHPAAKSLLVVAQAAVRITILMSSRMVAPSGSEISP